MMANRAPEISVSSLEAYFGSSLQRNVSLACYSTARVGGSAEILIETHTADELAETVVKLWALNQPFFILGGGSNVLISDSGVKGVVILNRARASRGIRFHCKGENPSVWAEAGVTLSVISRQAARRELGGLEWAAGIPGTLGGAVAGNAGAHGRDVASNLRMADILHRDLNSGVVARELWEPERLEFDYRTSRIKRERGEIVVLGARLGLSHEQENVINSQMDANLARRRKTQPSGASLGSMFKNPPGDHAGRLIEAAGLKGLQIGSAQISPLHGNFFIIHGKGRAQDAWALIETARNKVSEKFGIFLQLEVILLGDWPQAAGVAEVING